MKLSDLFCLRNLGLICLGVLASSTAWAFEPNDVPNDFRGTFVNCMAKGEADPVAGKEYAGQWLGSDAGGEAFAYFCLAVYTYRTGEPERAAELLESLAEHSDVRETDYRLRFVSFAGDLFDAAGDYEAAFRAYSKALDVTRFEPRLWVDRALARAALGDFEGTIEDLNLALALDADNVEALVFRGSSYLAVDEWTLAADDALQALLIEPFNVSALWLRSQIALAEGDYELAVRDLERIVERDLGDLGAKAQEALSVLSAANQKSTFE